MNKKQILELTFKELEAFLNTCLPKVNEKSDDESYVKKAMIEEAKKLFDKDVVISVPYYTNREIVIEFGQLYITFKVTSKATGKLITISKLKKKHQKGVGKFKFSDANISFYRPYFMEKDIKKCEVMISPNSITGGGEISLKHRKEKIKDMLTKDILKYELESQDSDWKDVEATVVLDAAQPMLKKAYMTTNLDQNGWDKILQKTKEVNADLINKEIEKIFKIKI